MRENLFRGKSKKNNIWVEGSLLIVDDKYFYIVPKTAKTVIEESDMSLTTLLSLNFTAVYPETLGQYTGKVDADGKRIFEGDILNIMLYGKNLKVVWWQGLCGFGLNDKDENTLLFMNEVHSNAVVVAGNIYDNPELMEE